MERGIGGIGGNGGTGVALADLADHATLSLTGTFTGGIGGKGGIGSQTVNATGTGGMGGTGGTGVSLVNLGDHATLSLTGSIIGGKGGNGGRGNTAGAGTTGTGSDTGGTGGTGGTGVSLSLGANSTLTFDTVKGGDAGACENNGISGNGGRGVHVTGLGANPSGPINQWVNRGGPLPLTEDRQRLSQDASAESRSQDVQDRVAALRTALNYMNELAEKDRHPHIQWGWSTREIQTDIDWALGHITDAASVADVAPDA